VAGAVVVLDVVDDVVVCADTMLVVKSVTPKRVRLLRWRIAFFIYILSYLAVTGTVIVD
jgi:hypothetical protein